MMTLEKQDTMRMEVLKRSVNRSIGGGGGKSSPPIARDGSGNMGRVWTATGMLNHNPNLRGHHINSRNYYGNSNDSTNSVKEEEPEGQGKQLGVIDLSGMCLDRIPNPNTFNPASIFKLDLSGNNLQVGGPVLNPGGTCWIPPAFRKNERETTGAKILM